VISTSTARRHLLNTTLPVRERRLGWALRALAGIKCISGRIGCYTYTSISLPFVLRSAHAANRQADQIPGTSSAATGDT
jgi:hypothetical protein